MDSEIIIKIVLIFIVIFALIREIQCWYWKINARLDEQKKTNELLAKIALKLGAEDISSANNSNNSVEVPEKFVYKPIKWF